MRDVLAVSFPSEPERPETSRVTASNAVRQWAAVACALALIMPLAVFTGVNLSGDDVLYGKLAADMAFSEPFFFSNPHPCRLGFIAPLAVLYRMFGVNEWTTIGLTLGCTLAAILLAAFSAGRLYGRGAAGWAALFCGLSPIIYRYGTMALADVPAGFFYGVFTAGWILLANRRVRWQRIAALATGAACALSMATRISTAPMVILTLAGFALYGWHRSKLRAVPLLYFFLGGSFIGLTYLVYIWVHTGTPFYAVGAAQTSYNVPGAPWLEPLDGPRFWFRLLGFSMVRSAVEGYLFAVFPIIAMAVFAGRTATASDTADVTISLAIAALSPLLILSHFPTTFEYWNPVRMDLRFGSPAVIPACILAAGFGMRLPRLPLAFWARRALALLLLTSAVIFIAGWKQQNGWTIAGASASLLVTAAIYLARRFSARLLPVAVSIILAVNWFHYLLSEYPEHTRSNQTLRVEAESALQAATEPILTDHITAQYLPWLKGYSPFPPVKTWKFDKPPDLPPVSFDWAEAIERPMTGAYRIVWYPLRARVLSRQWGGRVPCWVIDEVQQARLLRPFQEAPSVLSDQDVGDGEVSDFSDWPKAGLYRVETSKSG